VMADIITLIIHHGGRMQWYRGIPEYEGGSVTALDVRKCRVSYNTLIYLATKELDYDWVDRMWYLVPEPGDHSIGVGGLIHLLDDSDRTTDPEFYDALDNLGLIGMRRNYKVAHFKDGEEVEMLYGRIPPPEPVIPDVPTNNLVEDDDIGSDDENVPPAADDNHSGSDGDSESEEDGSISSPTVGDQGIQANQVQPTTRQQQEREVRQAMQGVGVYVSPTTGNTYYRASDRPPPDE
ncbi:hypothetical protein LINGRAHAP2_LOCUS36496, partial [Linum grandiflorum]